jgi:hypothetical protein
MPTATEEGISPRMSTRTAAAVCVGSSARIRSGRNSEEHHNEDSHTGAVTPRSGFKRRAMDGCPRGPLLEAEKALRECPRSQQMPSLDCP